MTRETVAALLCLLLAACGGSDSKKRARFQTPPGSQVVVPAAFTGVPIYDLEFEGPDYVVGDRPPIGNGPAPRDRASGFLGDPVVSATFAGVPDQAIELDSYNRITDGIIMDLAFVTATHYQIRFDLVVESIVAPTELEFYADWLGPRLLAFKSDGTVWVEIMGAAPRQIAAYQLGVPLNVIVEINTANDTCRVFLEGSLAYDGSFGGVPSIGPLHLGAPTVTTGVRAQVDDVLVFGQ